MFKHFIIQRAIRKLADLLGNELKYVPLLIASVSLFCACKLTPAPCVTPLCQCCMPLCCTPQCAISGKLNGNGGFDGIVS